MWTLLLFLNLVALHYTASTSPPDPVNVIFSSVNLRNVLQWLPGNGTPDDTHFTVQYAIYGDSVEGIKGRRVHWRAVRRCTEIVRSWCDLSKETWDLEHGYYGRVRAVSRRTSSKWALTRRRFDPKTDTSFGPPLVSVEVEDNNAIITLRGPMRYQPNNHTPAVSMATLYPMMTYNLSIDNTRRVQMHHFTVASSSYKYRMMEYNTQYCFSAKSRFFSMPTQCQNSAWQCITTPQDPVIGQLQRVVVGIVVPALCICTLVVVGYFLYNYLSGKGQKSPYILDPPPFYSPPLTFPPENPKLLPITIITEPLSESGKSNPGCPKRPQHVAHPSAGYASQRHETPPMLEEPWDDSSIDYGFIGVAPKINNRAENGNNLDSEHQKCNSYEKKDWRVENGHSTGDSQTEMSTLIQAQPWSQPVLRTQAPLPSFQGASIGEVDGEEEDGEFPGLFINTTPQTGLFNIPLNLQTMKDEALGEEVDRKMRVRTDEERDGGMEERRENEEVPLLSAYASQNTTYMPTSHADQSDCLSDDYGVLRVDTAHKIETGEEEEGTICIDWDPQTRKLVLPEIAMEYNKAGGLDGLMQGGKGRENRMGGEGEDVKGELRLENVFVRQGSEERAEAQREMERGEGTEGDFFTRWNLVLSMDE
ncbi:interleukin-20 receptor subunit alpha [Centropristis striata]|uniref:interleukin-20 receptor subunit alpha n=1 Tax=Centropristis striata TaxID=184440 RepID=UPI0027DFFD43|nr:interleukin-20 receptor subunit alpha [Centropristis striata]